MVEIALKLIIKALKEINLRDGTQLRKIILYDDGSWSLKETVGRTDIEGEQLHELADILNGKVTSE